MIHHLYIVILVLRQLSFPLLSSQSYPRSAHRNGLIANSPFPNYLPPSGSFIVVSLSPYQNMYVHVHHIKASYENSSVISERTRLHSISVVIVWTSWDCFTSQRPRLSQLPGTRPSLFSASGPTPPVLRDVTLSPNSFIEPSDRLFYALDGNGHRSTPHLSKHHIICSLGVTVGSETPCHNGFARSLP